MPVLNLEETKRIATLARLALSPAELERLTGELSKILEYIDQLQSAPLPPELDDTLTVATHLREDDPRPSLPVEVAARNAPSFADGFFIVPKVIGGD